MRETLLLTECLIYAIIIYSCTSTSSTASKAFEAQISGGYRESSVFVHHHLTFLSGPELQRGAGQGR